MEVFLVLEAKKEEGEEGCGGGGKGQKRWVSESEIDEEEYVK